MRHFNELQNSYNSSLPIWPSLTESPFAPLDFPDRIDVKFNGLKAGKGFCLFSSSFLSSPDSHLWFRPPFLLHSINPASFFIYHASATISKKTPNRTLPYLQMWEAEKLALDWLLMIVHCRLQVCFECSIINRQSSIINHRGLIRRHCFYSFLVLQKI